MDTATEFKSYTPTHTAEDIKQLILDKLPGVDAGQLANVRRLNSGEINAVYTIADKYVLRVSPAERGVNQFDKEAWVLQKCESAGIVVPHVIHVDTTSSDFPEPYVVLSKISGFSGDRTELELTPAERSSIVLQLGQELRKLHAITTNGFGRLEKKVDNYVGKSQSVWEFIQAEIDGNWGLKKGIEMGIVAQEDIETVRETFNRYKHLFNIDHACLIHAELAPSLKNVMVARDSDNTPFITGIIDFENTIALEPAYDFARFAFWTSPQSVHYIEDLAKGYGIDVLKDPNFINRMELYKLLYGYSMLSYYHARNMHQVEERVRNIIDETKTKLDTM